MRIAYADPPYPGCAHLYRDHPDYAGEVDHARLVYELVTEYDGYCLHTSSPALADVLARFQIETNDMPRVMAWVKPFAAFKANVPVAYAWEPVLVKAARKPVVKPGMTYRDWIAEPITLKRGLKPDVVCRWLFEVMGCEPDDELVDLYPGTGAVTDAWQAWASQLRIPMIETSVGLISRLEYNEAARVLDELPFATAMGDDGNGNCRGCGQPIDQFDPDCAVCMAALDAISGSETA